MKDKQARDVVAQDIQRFESYMHATLEERGFAVSSIGDSYAIPPEAAALKPKDSSIVIAAFLAAGLPTLQREATSESPSWEFVRIYGLACSVVPNESAVKRITSISGKKGKAKQQQVVDQKNAPRNEQIIAYAKSLVDKGKGGLNLAGKVSMKFTAPSERQVRRILEKAGVITPKKS